MNYLAGLPWRIAALAGLIVGAISLLTGADPWTSLLRVGAAFAVFGVAGFGLSFLLQADPPPGRRSGPGSANQAASEQPAPEDAADSE